MLTFYSLAYESKEFALIYLKEVFLESLNETKFYPYLFPKTFMKFSACLFFAIVY